MIGREAFVGPWAGLPVAWTDNDRFDEETYRGDVARCCEAGMPGVYTGGTTGEFYAMEFDEFQPVARATVEECRVHDKPVMIGEVWSQAYKENCRPLSTTATQERAAKIEADLARSTEYGVDGYLLWNYSHGAVMKEKSKEYFCSTYGYFEGDPVFPLLGAWTQERSSD